MINRLVFCMVAACASLALADTVYPAAGVLGVTSENVLSFDVCSAYVSGFIRDGTEIVCDNGDDATGRRGAVWQIDLDQEHASPFIVTAESCAVEADGTATSDYSLYIDVYYVDGTKLYGQAGAYEPDPQLGWQRKTVMVVPAKPISYLRCYLLYRNRAGKVRFREPVLKLFEGSVAMYDTCLVDLLWQAALPGPSFIVRDVTADRGFVAISPGGEAEGIALAVETETRGGATFFDVTATNRSGVARAVTLVYAVPVPGTAPAVWHDDPRTAVPLDPAAGGQFRSVTDQKAGEGPLSRWPFGAVTAGDAGVALGIDCSAPAFFRTTAHASLRQLFIAFDLGFAPEKPTAHFRFVRFGFDPRHGFRGALAAYQRLFPEFNEVRLRKHGLWMAFQKISSVAGWEDFGFAVKEGDNETVWDDAHGILTFRYTEPSTWWMRMPKGTGDYDLADGLAEANRLAAKGDPLARAWRVAAFRDAAGNAVGLVKDEPWCKGVVWNLCPLPDLPDGEYAHKFSADSWAKRYGGRTFPQGMDGEYIDSAEGYVTAPLDFDRAHFAHSRTPLVFDPGTKRPALAKPLMFYEYISATADRCHAAGRHLMGNVMPARWPWLVAYSDYGGQEVSWIDRKTADWKPMDDGELLYRRAMNGGKPYCFLMNVDFDRFPPELVEKYMQRTLAYGIFPGFFSPDASRGHYFSRPELYNRDRPLFRKYVPLCRTVSKAGWRPVNTLAVSENPAVFVEQFGERYLTVFNPGTEPQKVQIRSLTGAKRATELVAGGDWRFTGGVAEATLPPETVRLLDFGGSGVVHRPARHFSTTQQKGEKK